VGRVGRLPAYTIEDLLRAVRFAPDVAQLFRFDARSVGFD